MLITVHSKNNKIYLKIKQLKGLVITTSLEMMALLSSIPCIYMSQIERKQKFHRLNMYNAQPTHLTSHIIDKKTSAGLPLPSHLATVASRQK